jgi:hypothetical protein
MILWEKYKNILGSIGLCIQNERFEAQKPIAFDMLAVSTIVRLNENSLNGMQAQINP